MIDRKFIKELNDLGLLVNHEEEQHGFNSNDDVIIGEAYKIRYKREYRYSMEDPIFFDLVKVSIRNGYASMEILDGVKELPVRLIIDMLKIVNDKVETFNSKQLI